MSWSTSNRKQRLPKEWISLRSSILRRDGYRCQIRSTGCNGIATDVDHIAAGDNHDPKNLQAACRSCHRKKSSAEGVEARRRKRAMRFRPTERHPGRR